MDPLGDPLRDAFNPPPRYSLESDSEDEVGGGLYGVGSVSRKNITAKKHGVTCDAPLSNTLNGQLIIGIGSAGAEFASRMKKSGEGNTVKVDGIVVGTAYTLPNGTASMLIVSGRLPNSVLYPLSSWIIEALKPSKLSILDVYPIPLYIQNGDSKTTQKPIRYLQTSPSFAVPGSIKPFTAPNLLSTQTIASSLICVAQQRTVPALLLLLPFYHILRPPPRVLEHVLDEEGVGEDNTWDLDAIAEAFGVASDLRPASAGARVSPSRARGSARKVSGGDGMYI